MKFSTLTLITTILLFAAQAAASRHRRDSSSSDSYSAARRRGNSSMGRKNTSYIDSSDSDSSDSDSTEALHNLRKQLQKKIDSVKGKKLELQGKVATLKTKLGAAAKARDENKREAEETMTKLLALETQNHHLQTELAQVRGEMLEMKTLGAKVSELFEFCRESGSRETLRVFSNSSLVTWA